MSSGLKTFCHLRGVHKAESVAYLSRRDGRAKNAEGQWFDKLALHLLISDSLRREHTAADPWTRLQKRTCCLATVPPPGGNPQVPILVHTGSPGEGNWPQ